MPILVKRKEIMLYLDTKPNEGSNPTWGLYGKKSTTATYTYNPNSSEETYITEDNATVTLNSYNVTIDGDMKCYFGDAIYDYINTLRYKLATGDDACTTALLIDKYDKDSDNNSFKAQTFKATISIESYGGDGGEIPNITFTINLNGDPTQGSVTFTGETPTFVESVE